MFVFMCTVKVGVYQRKRHMNLNDFMCLLECAVQDSNL